MSGAGAPDLEVDGSGLRVAVVAAQLAPEGHGRPGGTARERTLAELGVEEPTLVRVPGSFELPVAAARLATVRYDAVVALGVVIRGGTPHFEYVCQAVTDGLSRVALDTGVPVGFGVLTCDDEQQALDRAGLPGSSEDKGREAAEAAVATAVTLRRTWRPRREDHGRRALRRRVRPAGPGGHCSTCLHAGGGLPRHDSRPLLGSDDRGRASSTTCSSAGSRSRTSCTSGARRSTGTGWSTASTCPTGCRGAARPTGPHVVEQQAYLMIEDGLHRLAAHRCAPASGRWTDESRPASPS